MDIEMVILQVRTQGGLHWCGARRAHHHPDTGVHASFAPVPRLQSFAYVRCHERYPFGDLR